MRSFTCFFAASLCLLQVLCPKMNNELENFFELNLILLIRVCNKERQGLELGALKF